jgi:hypothetical protein
MAAFEVTTEVGILVDEGECALSHHFFGQREVLD